LLEHMAFTTTSSRSTLKIVRDMEDAGWGVSQAASRESLVLSLKVLPGDEAAAVDTLAEVALETAFRPWEVAEMKKGRLGYSIGAANSSAEVQLSEALHAAAFLDSNPLGTPYMTSNAQSVSPDALAAHASATFSAGNMVLSAAGVADHAAFVAAAEASFGGAADGAASAPSPYGGGEVRVKTSGGQSYVALAFQCGDAATGAVLANLLSGFSVSYSDTGLFGAYGSCAAGGEAALVESMVGSIKAVASGVSASDFSSAANSAALAANTDGASSNIAENLGSSLLFSGSASAGLDFSGVSADSCASAAAAAIKSQPAVASIGALSTMPGIETVKGMF